MSNTSTVTPYVNRDSGNAFGSALGTTAVVCAGVVVGAAGLAVVGTAATAVGAFKMARWLAKKSRPNQGATDLPSITTINLHLRESDTLVSTAVALGFHAVSDTELFAQNKAATILLQDSSGERLAITKDSQGRLEIHTAGDQGRIHALVRQHTLDRTLAHLTSKGMTLQTGQLANGEVQILAREPNVGQPGGAAELRAQVRADGTTHVDIDKCRGNRCAVIVAELAQSVGGTVSGTTKKDTYFQLPGEPAKTRVKV